MKPGLIFLIGFVLLFFISNVIALEKQVDVSINVVEDNSSDSYITGKVVSENINPGKSSAIFGSIISSKDFSLNNVLAFICLALLIAVCVIISIRIRKR